MTIRKEKSEKEGIGMLIKNVVKKVLSVFTVISMIGFMCEQNIDSYAIEKNAKNKYQDLIISNGRNLCDKFKSDSALCKKLLYDKEHDTGILDEKKEQMLNEMGIMDQQLVSMDKKTIDSIENHEIISAVNVYYQVNSEGLLEKISADEIDEIASQTYENEIKKVKSDSILNKLWNSKAKAADRAYNNSRNDVNSGVLQQGIIVSTSNQSGVLRVWYKAEWLSSPHCRGIDICGVSTKYGTPLVDTVSVSHFYDYRVTNTTPRGHEVQHDSKTVVPKYYYNTRGVIATPNLYSSWSKIKSSNWYPYKMSLKEYIVIEYDLAIDKKNYKSTNMIIADYWHKKDTTTYQINPSFSSDCTISLGLTSQQEKTYTHVSPNLAANFTYSSGNK